MEENSAPTPAAPAETPALSEFDRLTGVLFDPKAAFADIVARPRWWVPLILLMVLSVTFTYAFGRRVGWERFMRQQMASNPRVQQLSPEQRERIIEQQTKLVPFFGYVGGTLAWPVIVLVASGAFLFVFNVLLGADLRFRPMFAATAYGVLPNFVGGIVAFVVLFLKDPADFDLQNPLVSNIGAFLDPNTVPRWLMSLAGGVDVFVIWSLVLLATGYAAAARKLSWSKAFTWVVATWILFLVLRSGVLWIFT